MKLKKNYKCNYLYYTYYTFEINVVSQVKVHISKRWLTKFYKIQLCSTFYKI